MSLFLAKQSVVVLLFYVVLKYMYIYCSDLIVELFPSELRTASYVRGSVNK